MASKTYRLREGNGGFLAPEDDVGSSVRYIMDVYKSDNRRRAGLGVYLTDCNKSISWHGFGPEGFEHMRKKLTSAIDWLVTARDALDRAEAHYNQIPMRKKKK